jgi:SPP1 gp7 family putative phage head morphogenesis protein
MADRSLLARLFGRSPASPPISERKSFVSAVTFTGPDSAHLTLASMLGGAAQRSDLERLTRGIAYATSAYCYTAMLFRASRLASAPLMVIRETEDGEEWLPDHPLAMTLQQPRPDMEMGELLERTQMYRDMTSGALWVTARDQIGRRTLVTPYSASEFRTVAKPPLIYGQYQIATVTGEWITVDPEQVIHFRETNPMSWREPLSKVDVALLQLDLGHNVNRIVRNFLTRAMLPGGIISPDKDWQPTDPEWETWKAQVEGWYMGASRQGRGLAVPGGTIFTPIDPNLQNLLPEAVLDRVEATVGSVFGTPPVVLGWLSGMKNSPWSQMGEARRQVYEDTIEPLWQDVERRLTMAWLTPEEQAAGIAIRFDLSRVTALKGDQEQQARISALASDVLTVNERRIMLGADPLPATDDRGEEIAGLNPAPLPGFGFGSGGNSATPDQAPADTGNEEPADLGKGQKAGSDTKDLVWLLFDLTTKANEPAWERVVYAHLQDLKTRLVKAAGTTKAEPIDRDRAQAAHAAMQKVLAQDRPQLTAKTYPLLVGTGGTAVRRLSARIGVSFARLEPGLLKYASEESAFLAAKMGETTGAAVAKTVQASLEEGETISGLRKRLDELPDFSRDRAKMVARTETTRAWNGAQRRSMSEYQRETGAKATKSWLSARDDRVRDEHQILDDGSFIPIDDTFGNGLTEPGEPNCRCTLLYGLEDGTTLEGTEP